MRRSQPRIATLRRLGAALIFVAVTFVQASAQATSTPTQDDSEVKPPVTQADIRIVQRASAILDSPSKWNRADNRICPADAKTFSIYCALDKATLEINGNFQHRGAAMQEARFVIDDLTRNRNYNHRLMDYNNDPTTTFADVQKVFQLLEDRIKKELAAR
jgi:hypothetical protein